MRDKIGSNAGRGAAFTDDNNLRWPGQHVDCAIESNETLGRGDIEIARPHDLVHARHTLCSVSQRSYCMRSAQTIKLRDAQQVRSGQRLRRGLWRNRHNAPDTRYLSGNRGHQQS